MSRRIRTTRQAARCRDQAKVVRMLRNVPPVVWSGMAFPVRWYPPGPIVGTAITADRITVGPPPPLYRLAWDRLGDPVIDWQADL